MKRVLGWVSVVGWMCASGCAVDASGASMGGLGSTCSAWGGTYSGVAFTDEEASNAIDFADHASAAELQALAGVGPAIASSIVAARPFAARPDPLAALDAVSRVGGAVLTGFRDHSYGLWCSLRDGRQTCCVDLGCSGLGGTTSGVELTDVEATGVLEWANHADEEELGAVCGVGATLAGALVAARPMRTLAQLDAVPGVGATTLRRFLGHEGYTCATKLSALEAWCGASGCTCEGAEPAPAPSPPEGPEWTDVTGSYHGDLFWPGGAVLPDGRLMIVGEASAEILSLDTTTLSRTGDPLGSRNGHFIAALGDGRVLAGGGSGVRDAELWDPASGAWSRIAPLHEGRYQAAAVTLADGRVMVMGGWVTSGGAVAASSTAEIYDPATDRWTLLSMSQGHVYHRAARMADGRVMVVGRAGALPEIFDPRSATFRTTGPTRVGDSFSLAVLASGRVVVSGGHTSTSGRVVQAYDPVTNAWRDLAPLPIPLQSHAAAPLHDGRMLVAGGWHHGVGPTARAFLYDPSTDAWTEIGSMPRALHQIAGRTLGDGRVAIFGRSIYVEVFNPRSIGAPPPAPPAPTTRTIDDRSQLDPSLDAAIDALIADGNPCDSLSTRAISFAYVVIHEEDGATWYQVVLTQPYDEGLLYSITYRLTATYDVVDAYCDLG